MCNENRDENHTYFETNIHTTRAFHLIIHWISKFAHRKTIYKMQENINYHLQKINIDH